MCGCEEESQLLSGLLMKEYRRNQNEVMRVQALSEEEKGWTVIIAKHGSHQVIFFLIARIWQTSHTCKNGASGEAHMWSPRPQDNAPSSRYQVACLSTCSSRKSSKMGIQRRIIAVGSGTWNKSAPPPLLFWPQIQIGMIRIWFYLKGYSHSDSRGCMIPSNQTWSYPAVAIHSMTVSN